MGAHGSRIPPFSGWSQGGKAGGSVTEHPEADRFSGSLPSGDGVKLGFWKPFLFPGKLCRSPAQ